MHRRLKASLAITIALMMTLSSVAPVFASSHREAPGILGDPLMDNTDTYAFRSTEPGREGFVTLLANYIPFQEPTGGPNYYPFDNTGTYEIKVDNTGDGREDITFTFRFATTYRSPNFVLGHATGPITSLDDPDYNAFQTYTVTVTRAGSSTVVANGIVPPSNVGSRTTPNYEAALAQPAVVTIANGARYFAGQRDEGFYINLGGIFDTLNFPVTETGGIDATSGFNVNTIAVEVPIQALTRDGAVPSGPTAANAVIGVWATASRPGSRVFTFVNRIFVTPSPVQISRLGNPLVNELVIPVRLKDTFNQSSPADDAQFAPFVVNPILPPVIAQLFGIAVPPAPRNDLVAIFATGIMGANFLSDGQPHEMMRLNVAVPPTAAGARSRLGVLGGDLGGYPNGRRVGDDVVDITLRAATGGTPFTPAFNVAPNNALGDGVPQNDVPYLERFPYLGTPHTGNIDGRTPPNRKYVQN